MYKIKQSHSPSISINVRLGIEMNTFNILPCGQNKTRVVAHTHDHLGARKQASGIALLPTASHALMRPFFVFVLSPLPLRLVSFDVLREPPRAAIYIRGSCLVAAVNYIVYACWVIDDG